MSKSIIPSDDEIAKLIAKSISSNKLERTSKLQEVSRRNELAPINKAFLQNTIRSVESHNRREVGKFNHFFEVTFECKLFDSMQEVDECWRQHELNKKFIDAIVPDQKLSSESNDYEITRNMWAKRKVSFSLSCDSDE